MTQPHDETGSSERKYDPGDSEKGYSSQQLAAIKDLLEAVAHSYKTAMGEQNDHNRKLDLPRFRGELRAWDHAV
jgi:hypothetical protein